MVAERVAPSVEGAEISVFWQAARVIAAAKRNRNDLFIMVNFLLGSDRSPWEDIELEDSRSGRE